MNNFHRDHKIIILILVVVFFIVGVVIGIYITRDRKISCDKYKFLNTQVVCGGEDVISKTDYLSFRNKLFNFIEKEKKSGNVNSVSVYFRDLEHGPVFGINELADFAPASLLKLPLAIVFMNSADSYPELLKKKIKYEGVNDVRLQNFSPLESAKPGVEYTIEELLRLMLVYSDNASYDILETFVSSTNDRLNLRLETFKELGIIDPKDRIETTLNVRGYSSIFRILYNVSYLSPESSEKILNWLSESNYDFGIKAGIPDNVVVANKFGERFTEDGKKQLYDCGIVYYPKNPYLICIMTRGNDWDKLTKTIQSISRMTYEEFDSRKL